MAKKTKTEAPVESEVSPKTLDRRKRIEENKKKKRYESKFHLSGTKLRSKTGKIFTRAAREWLENIVTSKFFEIEKDGSEFSSEILGTKTLRKPALDAKLEILRSQ